MRLDETAICRAVCCGAELPSRQRTCLTLRTGGLAERVGHDVSLAVFGMVVDRRAKGAPHVDDLARELIMNGKTLERRLGDRDTTFSALLDDIRSGLAKRYQAVLRLWRVTFSKEKASPVRARRRS